MGREEADRIAEDVTTGAPIFRSLLLNRFSLLLLAGLAIHCAYFLVGGLANSRGTFPTPIDDAYIHAVYAKNLVKGHLFTWSIPDGFSKGATTPLYPVILAVGWLIGFRDHWIMLFAFLVNFACSWLGLAIIFDLLRQRFHEGLSFAATALLLVCGPFIWGTLSGMEVSTTFVSVAWLIWLWERIMREGQTAARLRLYLLAGTLTVTLRPEACIAYGVLTLFPIVRYARQIWRWIPALILGPGVPMMLYCALNAWHTGNPLPNSMLLKSIWGSPVYDMNVRVELWTANVGAIPRYAADSLSGGHLTTFSWTVMIVALGGILTFLLRSSRVLLAAMFAAIVAQSLFFCGQPSPFGALTFRYGAPFLPLAIVAVACAVDGFAALLRGAAQRAPYLSVAVPYVVLGALAVALVPGIGTIRQEYIRMARNLAEFHTYIGRKLRAMDQERDGNFVFLTHEGGAPIYFSEARAIDIFGLCSELPGYPLIKAMRYDATMGFEAIEAAVPPGQLPDVTVMFVEDWAGPNYAAEVIVDPEEEYAATYTRNFSLRIMRFPKESVGSGNRLPEQFIPDGWRVMDRIDIADLLSEKAHDMRIARASRTHDNEAGVLHDPDDSPPLIDIGRGLRTEWTITLKNLDAEKPVRVFARVQTRHNSDCDVTIDGVSSRLKFDRPESMYVAELASIERAAARELTIALNRGNGSPVVIGHLWAIQPEE